MSSEVAVVVGEVVKNASILVKAKDIANAHPIAAATVGVVTLGLATWGTYTAFKAMFGSKEKEIIVVQATQPPASPSA